MKAICSALILLPVVSILSLGSISPYGISLCRLKCLKTVGCSSFTFSETHLFCCIAGNGNISICSNRGDIFQMTRSNVSDCTDGSSIFKTRSRLTLCKSGERHAYTTNEDNSYCSYLVHDQNGSTNYSAQFIKDIRNGLYESVLCMISLRLVDVNLRWLRGQTPVMLAALAGHKLVFDIIVKIGCDLTIKDDNNETVLHAACAGGNIDIVKTLIEEKHMDKEMGGHRGETPLLKAVSQGRLEVFDYLKQQGCKIAKTDELGFNAMHLACLNGNVTLVTLLAPYFGTESKTKNNVTPVMCAAMKDHVPVLDYLMSRTCSLQARCSKGYTALHYASLYDNVNFARKLIRGYWFPVDIKSNDDMTAFLVAAYFNSSRVMKFLVSCGCNKYAVDSRQNTALHIAAARGNFYMVKLLVDTYKFDVHVLGVYGRTSLGLAAIKGDIEIVHFLLLRGADPLSKDRYMTTVLHFACIGGNTDIVKELIEEYSLNIHALNQFKRSPLTTAARYGNYNAFQLLLKKGANLDQIDNYKNTIFHRACEGGNLLIVKLLIKLGKENSIKNMRKQTPFDYATGKVKKFLRSRSHF